MYFLYNLIMPTLVYKDKTINYYLAPSKRRRSVSMRVNKDESVEVRAPRFVTKSYIADFIKNKADWIIKKQDGFKELSVLHPTKEFKTGEEFPLFDRILKLNITRVKNRRASKCVIDGANLNFFVNDKEVLKFKSRASKAIRDFYSEQAKIKAAEIIGKYSKILNVNAGGLSVANQKKRWGSCCAKGNIRLNWRLAMMPFSVMEYIVVHEVCHLKVHGHGAKFWRVVESVLPDYKKHLKWLRINGVSLFLVTDWE